MEERPKTEENIEENVSAKEEIRDNGSEGTKPEQKNEYNATLDEDEPKRSSSDDADSLQDELLEESGMNAFQKYINHMDDRKWTIAQRITGAVLGVIASVALFWDTFSSNSGESASSGSFFTIPLVIALLAALIVPNIIEKQGMRRAPKLRTTMVIALVIAILIYVVYIATTKGFGTK